VLNPFRASSAGPDERLETFAGPSTGFARAKVSSAKTARLGHAAVEVFKLKRGDFYYGENALRPTTEHVKYCLVPKQTGVEQIIVWAEAELDLLMTFQGDTPDT